VHTHGKVKRSWARVTLTRSWASTVALEARERDGGGSGMSRRKRKSTMHGSGVVESRMFVAHSDIRSAQRGSVVRKKICFIQSRMYSGETYACCSIRHKPQTQTPSVYVAQLQQNPRNNKISSTQLQSSVPLCSFHIHASCTPSNLCSASQPRSQQHPNLFSCLLLQTV
jgi:hypothetical protein